MLAKSKLNGIEVLISKALINSNVSHDKFVLVNKVPKEYDDMKEEIEKLKTLKTVFKEFKEFKALQFNKDFSLFIKRCYRMVWSAEKMQKVKIQNF